VVVRFDIRADDVRVITVTGSGQTGVDLVRDLEI
jgi:hypothetical protein